jgi:nucleolar protein 4
MAEAALKGVNGTRIYSGMAAERIASEGGKEGKKKEVREKKKAEKAQFQGGGGEKGRVVAVDWALSKEDWEKAQEEAKEGASESGSGSDSGEDSEEDKDSEDGEESEEEDEDSDTDPIPVGLDDDGKDEEHDSEDEEEEDAKPKQEGTTLFVRNMSFEATEAELYDLYVLTPLPLFLPSNRVFRQL